jgi:VanZ family protein
MESALMGLILVLIIGIEEYSQQFFARRTYDLVDLTFSYLGVLFFSWRAIKM